MSIDTATVTKIAKLSRIAVKEEEKAHLAKEISTILNWVEQLQEVKTDDVPQMTSVAAMELPRRKDEVTDGNYQEAVLINAPASDYGCFLVPKVIE